MRKLCLTSFAAGLLVLVGCDEEIVTDGGCPCDGSTVLVASSTGFGLPWGQEETEACVCDTGAITVSDTATGTTPPPSTDPATGDTGPPGTTEVDTGTTTDTGTAGTVVADTGTTTTDTGTAGTVVADTGTTTDTGAVLSPHAATARR